MRDLAALGRTCIIRCEIEYRNSISSTRVHSSVREVALFLSDANQPIADKSAYTVLVVQRVDLHAGLNLVLTSDYSYKRASSAKPRLLCVKLIN